MPAGSGGGISRAGRNVRMKCMPGGGPVHRVGVGMKAGFVSLQSGGNVGVRLSDESIKLRCNYPGNWENGMLRCYGQGLLPVKLCVFAAERPGFVRAENCRIGRRPFEWFDPVSR